MKDYRIPNFDEAIWIIYAINPMTTTYLSTIDYRRWARAHFPDIQYNIMTINIVKLFMMMPLEFLHSTLQKNGFIIDVT